MQKRKPSGRLGELLIESGHLQVRDLEKALEIQRVAGGHLGTNLLEMGVIDEETLLEAVGRLHENPTVAAHRLASIPKEVSSKVPRDLVRRHSIVPFALHGNTVYIASQRPGDIHIENEVTLATSRLTRTFVGLELRVQEALHRHHGHSLPLRFSRLAAKLSGLPVAGPTATPAAPLSPAPGFVLERQQVDSTEWISGTSRDGHSSFTNSVPAGSEVAASTSITPASPSQDPSSTSRPDIFRVLDQGTVDRFDPTLASTVGRRIVWKDFEVDDVDLSNSGDQNQPAILTERETPQPATADSDAAPTSELSEPFTAPLPENAAQAPTAGQPASEPREPGHSAVQSLLEIEPAEADASGVHQFPFAVRGERKRRLSGAIDFNKTAAQEPGNRLPTVESEVLDAVSSPQRSRSTAILEDAHAALLEATNREAVGRILMQGFRPFFKRRLLLAKRGDQIRGWRADGPGVRPRVLSDLSFLVGDGTPFLSIQNGSRFWLSSYRQDRGFDALCSVLGPVQAPDCMILPLRAGNYIVGFLYGDNENDTVTGQPLNEFLELSDAAGGAFERIIRRLRETDSKAPTNTKQPAMKSEADPWRQSQKVPRHAS